MASSILIFILGANSAFFVQTNSSKKYEKMGVLILFIIIIFYSFLVAKI
jgi:hypothetical protein